MDARYDFLVKRSKGEKNCRSLEKHQEYRQKIFTTLRFALKDAIFESERYNLNKSKAEIKSSLPQNAK